MVVFIIFSAEEKAWPKSQLSWSWSQAVAGLFYKRNSFVEQQVILSAVFSYLQSTAKFVLLYHVFKEKPSFSFTSNDNGFCMNKSFLRDWSGQAKVGKSRQKQAKSRQKSQPNSIESGCFRAKILAPLCRKWMYWSYTQFQILYNNHVVGTQIRYYKWDAWVFHRKPN